MMKWTVRHRNTTGTMVETIIDAESRDAVFAQLRSLGIQAVEVRECLSVRNKPGTPFTAKSFSRFVAVGFILFLIIAVGVIGWNILKGGNPTVQPSNSPSAKKRTNQTKFIADKPTYLTHSSTNIPSNRNKGKAKPKDTLNGKEVESRHVVTNANGTVVERILTTDGKSHRITRPQKNVFDNPSDQLIALAVSGAHSGIAMPPLPMSESLEEDFKKSLKTPIVILDTDSDEVKLMKLNVMAVRDDLKELVAQGMTVRQALTEHQEEVNRIAAYHQDALRMYNDIKRTEGTEAANVFLKSVNERLNELGVKSVEVPLFSRSGQNATATDIPKEDQ